MRATAAAAANLSAANKALAAAVVVLYLCSFSEEFLTVFAVTPAKYGGVCVGVGVGRCGWRWCCAVLVR